VRWSTISAIGDFTALNGNATDYLSTTPGRCTDSPSLRTTVEDAPGADGVLVFPPLDGARILTIGGEIIIRSAGGESGYLAAIDMLYNSLASALASLKTAPDDLVHSGGTLSVWLYSPLVPGWEDLMQTVTFGLVVA